MQVRLDALKPGLLVITVSATKLIYVQRYSLVVLVGSFSDCCVRPQLSDPYNLHGLH